MRLQPGMIWLTMAPAALCGGAVVRDGRACDCAGGRLPFSKTLVTQEERDALADVGSHAIQLRHAGRQVEPTEPRHADPTESQSCHVEDEASDFGLRPGADQANSLDARRNREVAIRNPAIAVRAARCA